MSPPDEVDRVQHSRTSNQTLTSNSVVLTHVG
jgi:hypothetical protein